MIFIPSPLIGKVGVRGILKDEMVTRDEGNT
jgi:hypothetical protein